MKKIEVDDELYHYIASRTQFIGETASEILRRLLKFPSSPQTLVLIQEDMLNDLKNLANEKNTQQNIEKNIVTNQKKEEINLILNHLDILLSSDEFINETKAVRRFLSLLSLLYLAAPERFTYGTENIQGSERVYFAQNEELILSTGSGVRAKQIPETPFWVITNNNTERKGIILTKLMEAMEIPEDYICRIKVFFS